MYKKFIIAGAFAIAATICFFHIDSYVADKHHLNWLFIGAGVVLGLLAIFFLSRSAK